MDGSYRLFRLVILVLLVFLTWCFFLEKIDLASSDLGRHLKNGEEFFRAGHIVATNFYSYTQPDYPVVTHHWGAGVLFYAVWNRFGFPGLSVFHASLGALSFLLVFLLTWRRSSFGSAALVSVAVIPVLVSRAEIRPEIFSYLLLSIEMYLLYEVRSGTLNRLWCWVIPVLFLLWVNLHVFFIFGVFLLGLFLVDAWSLRPHRENAAILAKVLVASLVACCINPFGLPGAVEPLILLKEYGYPIIENLPTLAVQRGNPGEPSYWYFEILLLVSFVLAFVVTNSRNYRSHLLELVTLGVFAILAWRYSRAVTLFALLSWPIISVYIENLAWVGRNGRIWASISLATVCVVLVSGLLLKDHHYSPYRKLNVEILQPSLAGTRFYLPTFLKGLPDWLGLYPGVNRAAGFFRENALEGPIFNNYDIGSYLIFHLFPGQRVFVDNRPEAYSVAFFRNVYIPMQNDDALWHSMASKAGFNAIFFFRNDLTSWGNRFLENRLRDPDWALVYLDAYAFIFLRRNKKNGSLINELEIRLPSLSGDT